VYEDKTYLNARLLALSKHPVTQRNKQRSFVKSPHNRLSVVCPHLSRTHLLHFVNYFVNYLLPITVGHAWPTNPSSSNC